MLDVRLGYAALVALALLPCAGARACSGLADGPAGVVTEVLDGNTVKLDSGILVRLIGAQAPLSAGRRPGSRAQPLAAEAKAALEQLVLGKPVRLGLDSEELDRYGHMQAQLFVDDSNAWIEQEMLARGMARVVVAPQNRACIAELIAAENGARSNRLGIWADPDYSVFDAADPAALEGRAGQYEIIEGDVVGTGEARGRVYIDFGRVWKDDVTATIDQKARALFVAAGIDPLSLKGKRVRVRGWLANAQGPLVELDVPEQLEVLGSK
ncbi:MAG TPA: thermonuclease family protein [Devosiaceae bacterium]|nr:thermonuclease family protein [Devosiaceae bacterium]